MRHYVVQLDMYCGSLPMHWSGFISPLLLLVSRGSPVQNGVSDFAFRNAVWATRVLVFVLYWKNHSVCTTRSQRAHYITSFATRMGLLGFAQPCRP